MKRWTMMAAVLGLLVGGIGGTLRGSAPNSPEQPGPEKSRTVDHQAWARKLAGLTETDWNKAFTTGQELADLPADEGFAILRANLEAVGGVNARQALLRGWAFAGPNGMSWRDHPRLLDALDLGMRDRSPTVQVWALQNVNILALRDFSEDFQAYKAWFEANRGRPLADVVAGSVRRFAAEAAHSVKSAARKQAQWLANHQNIFTTIPEARRAAIEAGLPRTLARWAGSAGKGSPPEDVNLAWQALYVLSALEPGEAEMRRVVMPLLSKDTPPNLRNYAINVLANHAKPWAVDLLLDLLEDSLEQVAPDPLQTARQAAGALASTGDARVIPLMIASIVAHDDPRTVNDLGVWGLGRLTGVTFDASHDGTWWRAWWQRNREKYPEAVRRIEIPAPQERPRHAEEDPAADGAAENGAGVPAQELRAGRDEKKRYFLIGGAEKGPPPPADGYGLLVVVPDGGDSAASLPRVRRIRERALDDRWVVAQAVPPKWDEDQFKRIVWPTDGLPYPAAQFTTEELIRAIIADVRARVKVHPRRVFLLGWSSGGPACYASALEKDSGVTAAFVAMATFRPGQLPALENAKGKAFFLLHSPQDRVTPIRRAESAESALRDAGATVRLERYDGGHGWHGDQWGTIREGIRWLDQQVGAR